MHLLLVCACDKRLVRLGRGSAGRLRLLGGRTVTLPGRISEGSLSSAIQWRRETPAGDDQGED